MSTSTVERFKSSEKTHSTTKLRSPSPPVQSRAASQAPTSPNSIAARLTSPAAEPAPPKSPAPERTPTPETAPLAPETAAETPSDSEDAEVCPEDAEANGIDFEAFDQILQLDDPDDPTFSLGMTEAYFSQASSTFGEMDTAFKAKDLPKLSSLGHYLKGSSASLGVSAVRDTCELIQHFGALRDEDSGTDLSADAALTKIAPLLKRGQREYAVAERWLKNWYKQRAAEV